MPNGTAGTTNRDLIETMLGYQPGQVSPAVLIQMLRQKQQMAVEEDTDTLLIAKTDGLYCASRRS